MGGFILDMLQILTTITMVVIRIVPIFYEKVTMEAFIVITLIYLVTLVFDGEVGHGLSVGQSVCLTLMALDFMFGFVARWSGDLKVVTWVWVIIGALSILLNGIQMYKRWNSR